MQIRSDRLLCTHSLQVERETQSLLELLRAQIDFARGVGIYCVAFLAFVIAERARERGEIRVSWRSNIALESNFQMFVLIRNFRMFVIQWLRHFTVLFYMHKINSSKKYNEEYDGLYNISPFLRRLHNMLFRQSHAMRSANTNFLLYSISISVRDKQDTARRRPTSKAKYSSTKWKKKTSSTNVY